ncbi:hypothetical protein Scep_016330 [Stephania cephalantha]|uniref:peptidylprolyl isomerase n=1 Tax=Stephania cephalantha TaxID=152367 RepID=A0AAP0NSI1_9MAGN
MASFFSSPTFLSHPVLPRTHTLFSSPSDTPNPSSTPTPPTPSKPQSLQTPSSTEQPTPLTIMSSDVDKLKKPNNVTKSKAESTDWIASTITRRFGLGAGLAWVAFLAVGVVSEQVKTRFEVLQQEANTREIEKEEEVVLPNGIRYYEMRVGGGSSPRAGDLVVIDLKGKVEGSGKVFVNTFEGEQKKPLALVMGSRPYTKGMCEGIEYVLRSMRAGGKRRVVVPPSLGFGEHGADLGSDVQIPPFATLEYVVEVDKVSIAPA